MRGPAARPEEASLWTERRQGVAAMYRSRAKFSHVVRQKSTLWALFMTYENNSPMIDDL